MRRRHSTLARAHIPSPLQPALLLLRARHGARRGRCGGARAAAAGRGSGRGCRRRVCRAAAAADDHRARQAQAHGRAAGDAECVRCAAPACGACAALRALACNPDAVFAVVQSSRLRRRPSAARARRRMRSRWARCRWAAAARRRARPRRLSLSLRAAQPPTARPPLRRRRRRAAAASAAWRRCPWRTRRCARATALRCTRFALRALSPVCAAAETRCHTRPPAPPASLLRAPTRRAPRRRRIRGRSRAASRQVRCRCRRRRRRVLCGALPASAPPARRRARRGAGGRRGGPDARAFPHV
jgi:hypothetical protein